MLLAVLASPPLSTTGCRTRARVHQAANIVECGFFEITNLIDVATNSVIDITTVGRDRQPWIDSRAAIGSGLDRAAAVLFAWGASEPTGPARHHHRSQVGWLTLEVAKRGLSTWSLGDVPRHPSRWQRHTSRNLPGVPFELALAQLLVMIESHPDGRSLQD